MARIIVVGGGAIGLLLSAAFVRSGRRVELLVRSEAQRNELLARGLHWRSGEGADIVNAGAFDSRLLVHTAASRADGERAAAAEDDEPPFVVLAVKQTSINGQLAALTKALCGPSGRLICLQNGIGHVETLAAHMPIDRIWLCVTTEGALKHSPWEVEHTGKGTTWFGSALALAEETFRQDEERAQKSWLDCLTQAGFAAFVSKDMTSRVWRKLMVSAVINPLTAVLRVRNGELLEQPDGRRLMALLYEEAAELAARAGHPLPPDGFEQVLDVCRRTAGNRSSMLQDVLAGRETEIEAISGGLLRQAEKQQVPMPTTEALYRIIKVIQQRSEGQAD